MRTFPPLLIGCILCVGCTKAVPAPVPKGLDRPGMELVAEANAMLDSIDARMSERDLVATVATEHIALLDMRADKLRARCQTLDAKTQASLEPHLKWLEEVHATALLATGVLRNEKKDFEEGKAEVLLWAKTFGNEIDSLERRLDRAAPPRMLFSQRGADAETAATRGTGTRRAARLR